MIVITFYYYNLHDYPALPCLPALKSTLFRGASCLFIALVEVLYHLVAPHANRYRVA